MSRYSEGDPDYSNAYDLWAHNVDLAIRGKRGKQALRDLKEALLALPEKRLIEGALCTVGGVEKRPEIRNMVEYRGQPEGVCAIGAYVWWQKVKTGIDPTQAFEELPTLEDEGHDLYETAEYARSFGITTVLAWEISYRNDESYGGLSPEERYQKFLAWIDNQLSAEPVVRPAPKPKPVRVAPISPQLGLPV